MNPIVSKRKLFNEGNDEENKSGITKVSGE
jgi:hypothetical protein